jgi:PAS domain S-box-containing protein
MGIPIRVLIVEDSEDDALLTLRELKNGGYDSSYRVVSDPDSLSAALDEQEWDIILSDFQLPSFDGWAALEIVQAKGIDVPFIVISGVLMEERAVEILKAGASDYVRKGNWSRLIPAIGRELREARSRKKRECAELEKAKAQEQYRTLFDSAVEGIFQSSPDGTFIIANPAMANLLGFDSPEELMSDITNIPKQLYVHSGQRQKLLEELAAEGKVTGFETEMYRKDGSRIWIALNGRGIFDETGNLAVIEGFVVDISKRKRAEEDLASMNRQLEGLVEERTKDLNAKAHELEQANERLQELDKLKSTFISSVSHELRTPLTSVLGFAKLIHRDFSQIFLPSTETDPKTARIGERICQNLDIIIDEGARLTRLINDFLDITRIEAGRMNWADKLIDPAKVIRGAADAVTGLFAQNPNVDLIVEVDDSLPLITVDPDRMTQVLINLLNNAAKFTTQGTVILRGQLDSENVALRISVEDTGPGIPPEDLDRIFKKFHQVEGQKAADDRVRGSGLGLSISRQIVDHYGGTISVRSTLGKGSTFDVVFPLD